MNIIGLTGPIGHGKTSFAKSLSKLENRSQIFESSQVIAEIVDQLHKDLKMIPSSDDLVSINSFTSLVRLIVNDKVGYNLDKNQLAITKHQIKNNSTEYKKLFEYFDLLHREPEILKYGVNDSNKAALRPILQWLGGFLPTRIDRAMWFKELVRRVILAEQNGCQLVMVGGIRYPVDAETLRQTGAKIIEIIRPAHGELDIEDPTERERRNIKVDARILNDGSLADLDKIAEQLLSDLKQLELKQSYTTKQA